MPDVLVVAAGKLGYPMPLVVQMESGDGALHLNRRDYRNISVSGGNPRSTRPTVR